MKIRIVYDARYDNYTIEYTKWYWIGWHTLCSAWLHHNEPCLWRTDQPIFFKTFDLAKEYADKLTEEKIYQHIKHQEGLYKQKIKDYNDEIENRLKNAKGYLKKL